MARYTIRDGLTNEVLGALFASDIDEAAAAVAASAQRRREWGCDMPDSLTVTEDGAPDVVWASQGLSSYGNCLDRDLELADGDGDCCGATPAQVDAELGEVRELALVRVQAYLDWLAGVAESDGPDVAGATYDLISSGVLAEVAEVMPSPELRLILKGLSFERNENAGTPF